MRMAHIIQVRVSLTILTGCSSFEDAWHQRPTNSDPKRRSQNISRIADVIKRITLFQSPAVQCRVLDVHLCYAR